MTRADNLENCRGCGKVVCTLCAPDAVCAECEEKEPYLVRLTLGFWCNTATEAQQRAMMWVDNERRTWKISSEVKTSVPEGQYGQRSIDVTRVDA